jgi:hypothetical protein
MDPLRNLSQSAREALFEKLRDNTDPASQQAFDGGLTIGGGSILSKVFVSNITLAPAQVANATGGEQTFFVNGAAAGDIAFVNKPTAQAGLIIAGVRISAASTIAIHYYNATGSAITPTTELYKIAVLHYA